MSKPKFDPLVGEIIGIADNFGWPIERGEGIVFHFDGPNKRIVIKAAERDGLREQLDALVTAARRFTEQHGPIDEWENASEEYEQLLAALRIV